MKRYILSPEAEEDLEAIKSHLLETAGLDVTRYVLSALRSGIQFLVQISAFMELVHAPRGSSRPEEGDRGGLRGNPDQGEQDECHE